MAIVTPARGRDPRLQWFPDCRFGLFVHFGLYALLGRGEWVQYHEKVPRGEYEELARRFNPRRFDADAWVDLAREAGARYIAVTAKHHDGFCLFDSLLTDYKITRTPFGRDLIGELVRACHRRGMRIVLYYSQPDWHHPANVHRPGAFKDLQPPPPDQKPDWPAFLAYTHGQVEELVTRYGRIDGIWFDGSHRSAADWRGRDLYRLIKRHQPHAVVNDRAGFGDFWTPERSLPDDLTGYLFEACESISARGWGYTRDTPQFGVPHLVESLVRMAATGGNYLLNVGPKPDGTVPAAQADRLRTIGRWLRTHGEAVYGTGAGRLDTGSPDLVSTRKDRTVYLHLLRWPRTDRLRVPGLRSLPREALLLAGRRRLGAVLTAQGLDLSGLPPAPPDALVQVVRLRFDAPPALKVLPQPRPRPRTVALKARGTTRLLPGDAAFHGRKVKGGRLRTKTLEGGVACITDWWSPEQWAEWRVASPARRRVGVRVRLACPAPYEGSRFFVEAAGAVRRGVVRATKAFDDFRPHDLGIIALPRGRAAVRLKVSHSAYGYVFADVEGIELRPCD